MAHECFEDEEVAEAMNRGFVNIKVDREERPDIDQIYMTALHATGEQGGWPLTMFLTPDARPFWGGTYFPKHGRYGRPGFLQVLGAIEQAWREQRNELVRSGEALARHVHAQLSASHGTSRPSRAQLEALAGKLANSIDFTLGGLTGAPKFPSAPFMHTLWLSWLETGNAHHRDAVLVTLRQMVKGGIYDHVGGGLCRYATDAGWNVPHFEKMLYDNAQLIRLLLWAHGESGDECLSSCIHGTVDWLIREMRTPDGAFASSLDADSGGEEGAFYTWTRSAIESVLGEDSDRFWTEFRLVKPEHWEGDPILRRREDSQAIRPPTPLLERLRQARDARIRPGRDDKVLVDWNALTIRALAEAASHFGREDWLAAAEQAYRSVCESSDGTGRLPHSILGAARLFPAMSSDYAAMACAAATLRTVTGQEHFAEDAVRFLELLDAWYGDESGTGHYLTARDAADVPIRIRGDVDEAVPSPTSQIVEAFSIVGTLTARADLLERAATISAAATGRIGSQPFGQAGIINASILMEGMRKLVIVEDSDRLSRVARQIPDPRRIDLQVRAGYPRQALVDGAFTDPARPGAYLCVGNACLPPINDPEELRSALTGSRQGSE
jgi:uncharacterized protein YyaL (SSP411 family)